MQRTFAKALVAKRLEIAIEVHIIKQTFSNLGKDFIINPFNLSVRKHFFCDFVMLQPEGNF